MAMITGKGVAVWTIERDNGDGRLAYRKSFAPLGESVRHLLDRNTGMVTADDLDGGRVGTIVVPEGTQFGETARGDAVIVLPTGQSLGADEAWALARDGRFGLSAITGR